MTKNIYTPIYSGTVSKHPLYKTWNGIKQRCFNKNSKDYKHYGEIGITMLKEWFESSEKFLTWIDENLGQRPDGYTLDRINPFGNYEPENLRWTDWKTQIKNIRDREARNKKISESHKGKMKSEDTRKKMSESRKGEKNHFYGKQFSEEHKRKMSESRKGEKNHFYGKHHSEDTRKKMSELKKGKLRSEETRNKISETLKRRSVQTINQFI